MRRDGLELRTTRLQSGVASVRWDQGLALSSHADGKHKILGIGMNRHSVLLRFLIRNACGVISVLNNLYVKMSPFVVKDYK